MKRIALTVNGAQVEAETSPRTHLADFLRERLNLTGTHLGCEHGICGACTVVMDGAIVRSCITYAVACDGADVRTIESFDDDTVVTQLREAFSREHALQCGYCTPGMLITARDLLLRKTELDEAEIRKEMAGNLCRCTGYIAIIRAIHGVMSEGMEVTAAPSANGHLGPAPGPGAASLRQRGAAAANDEAVQRRSPRASSVDSVSRTSDVDIVIGATSEKDSFTEIPLEFHLPHAPEKVWALMSDLQAVADAMPGAELDEVGEDGRISGRMSVKLGPMRPSFAGMATVKRNETERRIEIEGSGRDKRSASTAQGRIVYRLSEAERGSATRVEVVIAYKLSGLLAQFGRSGLIRDVVQRLGASFAQNIDARLAGRAPVSAQGDDRGINLFGLIWAILVARACGLFRRLRRAP